MGNPSSMSLSSEARVQQAQSRNQVELHNEKLVPEGDGSGEKLKLQGLLGKIALPCFLTFTELGGGKEKK